MGLPPPECYATSIGPNTDSIPNNTPRGGMSTSPSTESKSSLLAGFKSSKYLSALAIAIIAAIMGYYYFYSGGVAFIPSPLSFYESPFGPSTDPTKRAYATTVYDEGYVPGAILLGYSLRKHGMLEPQLATTMLMLHISGRLSEKSLQILQEVGWTTLAVEHIPHPPGRSPANNFMDQYTKLRLFELEEYQQIFYMDADMLVSSESTTPLVCTKNRQRVVRSFPEIWTFSVPLAAARDVRKGYGWLPTINAGSLLLKPNRVLVHHMLEIAPVLKFDAVFAEQGLLQAYWHRDMTILPYIYNGQLGIKRVFSATWEVFKRDVKIIHYTGLKPWQWHEEPDMPIERELWWTEWAEMENDRKQRGLESLGSLGRQ